jgi:hypothetical protein
VQLHGRRVSAFNQELCAAGTVDATQAGQERPATQFLSLLSALFVSSAPPPFAGAQPSETTTPFRARAVESPVLSGAKLHHIHPCEPKSTARATQACYNNTTRSS